jgi:hypothetical protein
MPNKKKTAVPTALAKLRDVKIDIPPVEFTDAAAFRAAYDTADQAVKDAAGTAVDKQVAVIAALAKMRSICHRGEATKSARKQASRRAGCNISSGSSVPITLTCASVA